MKVLLVCDQFPPGFGPRMGYLCKYLKREGCSVDVVSEYYEDTRYQFLCGNTHAEKTVAFYRKASEGGGGKGEWMKVMLADFLWEYKDRRMYKAVVSDPAWNNYDLVLCSTFRTFPLPAARRLARHFGVPLVADLRDIVEQYPDNSYILHGNAFGSGRLFRWISALAEKVFTARIQRQRNKVLRKADAVVSVSPWHQEFLKKFNQRSFLIYNGYDPEVFFPAPVADSVFRITYTGRLISANMRNPDLLFEAVARLRDAGKIHAEDFRLCWYVDKDSMPVVQAWAKEYGLEDFVECQGFVPASEVPAVLNRSSVLLQLANVADEKGPKGIMTTKFFEALAIGKPLLLVRHDESYLGALVEELGCGLAARTVDEVSAFLEAEYGKWKQSGSTQREVNQEIVGRFSRKEQALSFLRVFEQVVESRGMARK